MEEISNVDVLLWQCNQWIFIFYENRIFCSVISTLLTNCFENKSLYFFLSQILLIWIELLTPIKNKSKLKLFAIALVLTIDWNLWIFTIKNIPSVSYKIATCRWMATFYLIYTMYLLCKHLPMCSLHIRKEIPSKRNSYKHST